MLPNLAVTFSSSASSVFSDIWPCWPFLPSWCIFLSWLPQHYLPLFFLLSAALFCLFFLFILLFLISKYGELHSFEGLCFSLCFLLTWSHAPLLKAIYTQWLLTLFSVLASPVSSIVRDLLDTSPWSITGTSASAFKTVLPRAFFSSTNDALPAQLLKPEEHSSFLSSLPLIQSKEDQQKCCYLYPSVLPTISAATTPAQATTCSYPGTALVQSVSLVSFMSHLCSFFTVASMIF